MPVAVAGTEERKRRVKDGHEAPHLNSITQTLLLQQATPVLQPQALRAVTGRETEARDAQRDSEAPGVQRENEEWDP